MPGGFSSGFDSGFGSRKNTAQAVGGTLTPTGAVVNVAAFLLGVGGTFTPTGVVGVQNPNWLLIDDVLTWQGEWDVLAFYELDDVVLYKIANGNEWHVFVSKITHNIGNIPTSSADAWRRLYQEPLL